MELVNDDRHLLLEATSLIEISRQYLCVVRNQSISKQLILMNSKSQSVKFSLIESVICPFTDSSVKMIFSTIKSVNFH